ncbi:MAG: GWxTD domain-containing protein [Acidobacteriota bacterium]
MERRRAARWRLGPTHAAAALLLWAPLLLAGLDGCAARRPPLSGELATWARGPERWLLLPAERRRCSRPADPAAAQAFIAEFWRRRETRPGAHDFQRAFEERVALADQAYAEDELRGSLTDRGGALILLGSPAVLRSTPHALLRTGLRRAAQPVLQTIEIWGYRPADLPRLVGRKPRLARRAEIDLEFLIEHGHATLVSGRDLLTLAAKAAAREPGQAEP